MKRRKIQEAIIEYIRDHIGIFVLLGVLFVIGVVTGAIAVNSLGYTLKGELLGYLKEFLTVLTQPDKVQPTVALRNALWNNGRLILVICLSGLIVVGIPFILASVVFKGFIIGFTVAFLVQEMGIKGVILAFAAVLPQNLFAVPILLIISSAALSFALLIIRKRFFDKTRRIRVNIGYYLIVETLLGILLMATSLIEVYISPVFMKVLAQFIS